MSIISALYQINGNPIPVNAFDVHGASVGHSGHMQATTSLIALEESGFELVEESIASPTGVQVDLIVSVDGEPYYVFSGEYVSSKFSYRASSVTINARDWSGPIIDQKRVLVSLIGGTQGALTVAESSSSQGVSTQNQTLTQIVSAIAQQFDLTPVMQLGSGPNSNPTIGQIFGNTNDTVFSPTPKSLWEVLTRLARETGNIVYVNPLKQLVFGQPGAGLTPINLAWKMNPIPPGYLPLTDLNVEHNPRRNLTFQVQVLSYDPTLGQITKGLSYVVGSNMTTNSGSTVSAGMWNGPNAQSIASSVGTGKSSSKNQIPIYTYHVDGLTAAQAQARAQAIATDIAKRELIVHVDADFIPLTAPSNPATLAGAIDPEFASHQYFTTGYTHTMRMKKGRAEFGTSASLFDVQPMGAGSPVTAGTSS
jgi:hypothetical protein